MTARSSFEAEFQQVFEAHYQWLFRYLDRLTGDSALAADLVQETFTRLYRRESMPDSAPAWLTTVANNLFRDERSRSTRRLRLLSSRPPETTLGDTPHGPEEILLGNETSRAVRKALDTLPERDRMLLLLRHEGHSYRDLANALSLHEASVGSMLARASAAFRLAFEGSSGAPD